MTSSIDPGSGLDIFVTKSYDKKPAKQGVKVKKPQTEEKAKGLIGLNKGKKVAGAQYSVGNYKGKTLNLSKKDLGAKGRKAASAGEVKIQDTNYDAASKKVMSGGKALTGRVDLGGGNIAVYRNGVRVKAAAPKKAASGGSGGGRGGSSGGSSGGGSSTGSVKIGSKGKSGKNIGYTAGATEKVRPKNIGYTPSAGGPLSKASAKQTMGIKAANGKTVQIPRSGLPAKGFTGAGAKKNTKYMTKEAIALMASLAVGGVGGIGARAGAAAAGAGAKALGAGAKGAKALPAGGKGPKALPAGSGRTTVTFGRPVPNRPSGAKARPKAVTGRGRTPLAIEGPKRGR